MLFNRDLSWIQRRFWGQLFEASASGIWLLAVQNTVPEMLSIGPILSVCVSVCLSVGSTFSGALFGPILDRIHSYFQKKDHSKTGT